MYLDHIRAVLKDDRINGETMRISKGTQNRVNKKLMRDELDKLLGHDPVPQKLIGKTKRLVADLLKAARDSATPEELAEYNSAETDEEKGKVQIKLNEKYLTPNQRGYLSAVCFYPINHPDRRQRDQFVLGLRFVRKNMRNIYQPHQGKRECERRLRTSCDSTRYAA